MNKKISKWFFNSCRYKRCKSQKNRFNGDIEVISKIKEYAFKSKGKDEISRDFYGYPILSDNFNHLNGQHTLDIKGDIDKFHFALLHLLIMERKIKVE